MSAEVLRRASALMRERAEHMNAEMASGHYYWVGSSYQEGVQGGLGGASGALAASFHPAVALAVADWLDKEADAYEQYRASATTLALRVAPALAVARTYLGDQP